MPISWWPLISDYNRFSRSPGEAAAGTSLGYVVANTSFYLIGAALVLLGITSFGVDPQDPYALLATLVLLGRSALPLLAILVDETDNAFAHGYSAAVAVAGLRELVPRDGSVLRDRLVRPPDRCDVAIVRPRRRSPRGLLESRTRICAVDAARFWR